MTEPLTIVVAPIPQGTAVDYLGAATLPVVVTNELDIEVLVTSVTTHPQPEWETGAAQTIQRHETPEFIIGPHRQEYRNITLAITPLFRAATNAIDLLLTYRAGDQERTVTRSNACYLVIHDPPATRGQFFISFKDPEDLGLAKLLQQVARRCGFQPYLAKTDLQPGTRIWEEKIPPAIYASKYLACIWTKHTPFGAGTGREVRIAATAGIKLIPFLEAGAPKPDEYPDALERVTFERDTAPAIFSATVASLIT